MNSKTPALLVFSSLYPSAERPGAGVFIRERMTRVGRYCPITVVSPVPWFPFQHLIRYWRPDFRPQPVVGYEEQNGISVYFPRFFSIPGLLKSFDGFFMALGSLYTLVKLKKTHRFNIIDAHFAYPDGYAATLLGRWLKVPVTITLRGTEIPLSKMPGRKKRIVLALKNAAKVFSVADSLKRHVISLGANEENIQVVGNGVDTDKFRPVDRNQARRQLKLPNKSIGFSRRIG